MHHTAPAAEFTGGGSVPESAHITLRAACREGRRAARRREAHLLHRADYDPIATTAEAAITKLKVLLDIDGKGRRGLYVDLMTCRP